MILVSIIALIQIFHHFFDLSLMNEGSLPRMFKTLSPRQQKCPNQKNISDKKTSNNNQSFEFNFKLYFGLTLCPNAIYVYSS